MALTKNEVRDILGVYLRAWVEQDPDLIVTIFTHSATYHERVLEEPIRNREGIRRYWREKVVESQGAIECELLNLYLDGDTAIAEWEARFDDRIQGIRKRIREVAILEFEGRLVASLREYWASERIGETRAMPPFIPRSSTHDQRQGENPPKRLITGGDV